MPDVFVEKRNFYGASIEEALQSTADEARLFFYVDFDQNADGKPTVHVFRNEAIAAPFAMDNEPDYSTTYPFREFKRERDSVELATAVLVEPKNRKDSKWSKDTGSIALYGRQERFISDFDLKGTTQATNVGERALAQYDTPQV